MMKQFEKKQFKQLKNQSQSGRSMVEMLGVLAIIAILSIGGIVGFRLAMNYYQANQIAHEMNMMRTDAQIKIAQGAEKLTLGSPYDEHKINFNDYGTDFGCIYMEDENATPDPAFCTAANAYYIELQEIPEGVCKPLANLIDKMDNEIAFYINEKSVDAEAEGDKGACNEEFNTLKVIFGADSDSNAIKCDGVGYPDCPEDLPVCLNHMCVECTENSDCENPKPYCNPTTNTCEPCQNDSQCDTAQNEHCTFAGECVVCDENTEVWDNDLKECRPPESCEELNCSNGKFCLSTNCSCVNNQETNCEKYECLSTDTQFVPGTADNKTYYGSKHPMNWWSAKRFCEAAKGKVSGGKGMMASWGNPDFKCAHTFYLKPDEEEWGHCLTDPSIPKFDPDSEAHTEYVSETIKELREMYQTTSTWFPALWLTETTNICGGYYVYLYNGRVTANWTSAEGCPIDQPTQIHGCLNKDSGYAFCE